jgi:hypothetical protein
MEFNKGDSDGDPVPSDSYRYAGLVVNIDERKSQYGYVLSGTKELNWKRFGQLYMWISRIEPRKQFA